MRNCDMLTGYKTYPHVDMYESGELAGRVLAPLSQGRGETGHGVRHAPAARADAADEHR